jgi:hypothetical protein
MKRFGVLSVAFGLVAFVSSVASAAPRGHGGYHDELDHRAYHRELVHRDAHRQPMTGRQHERLHDALEHEAYHDRLERRAYHRPHDHYHRTPVYAGGHRGYGNDHHGHGSYVASPSRGLGISTPRFSFWIAK